MNFNEINNFKLEKLTDFISLSLILYLKTFREILFKVLIPKYLSFIILFLIFLSLDGEFNLTFFLTKDGKLFLILVFLAIIFNQYNSIYKIFRIVCLDNLELRLPLIKLKLFLIVILRNLLLLLVIISIILEERYVFIVLTFLILNTLFYKYIYNQRQIIFETKELEQSFAEKLIMNLKATALISLNRILIILIPILVTFSIFIVYEFVRIVFTGKIFFFVAERISEFSIIIVFGFLLYLVLNQFQFFSLLIYYQYHHLRKVSNDILESNR